MNGIGSTGGADFIRFPANNLPAESLANTQSKVAEPQDKMEFASHVKADGKVSLIVNAETAEALESVKSQLITKGSDSKITADLPIINGFAVEVDSKLLPNLDKIGKDINVWIDGRITIPDTPVGETIEGSDVSAKMDVATKTLGIDKLWDKGITGKGTTICVIDTGIAQHPDMKDRIIGFKDFVNGKAEAYDDQGHGTHCAGIAAGDGKSSESKYKGAAPEANIVGVKVLDRNGSGSFSDVIKGIQWAIENKQEFGINVVSMSLGGPVTQPSAKDPVSIAAEKAVEAGLIMVVAAGNEGPSKGTIGTPGNAENVITIGAMDDKGTVARDDDKLAYFSSVGPTKYDNRVKPDILAPGVNITAASHNGSGYVTMSGTSMATPCAAGIAALAAQVKPDIKPLDLKKAAMDTAEKLPESAGALTPNQQGSGVIDPLKIISTIAPEIDLA